MTKTLWNCLLTNPAVCGVMIIVGVAAGNPVLAEETTTAKVTQPLAAESLEKDKLTISATRLNPLTEIQVARVCFKTCLER